MRAVFAVSGLGYVLYIGKGDHVADVVCSGADGRGLLLEVEAGAAGRSWEDEECLRWKGARKTGRSDVCVGTV